MPHFSSSVKLLDCTLRDGGYYNDWDFSLEEAQEYIDDLARGGVDIIEIGFRFTPKAGFMGPFAYTRESLLAKLDLPEGVLFGVMLNASDYLKDDWEDALEAAFVPASESPIGLVRVAAHLREVPKCDKMIAWLKNAGYQVGFNIMQISQADDAQITALIEDIEERFVPFEALYFADSLGNLTTEDVTRIVGLFRASTEKPVGFHGHDNIGLGVANSMAALEAGATWVDATITGMGRGAGNTQTEYLSINLNRAGYKDLSLLDIQRAATGWLATLKEECGWGTNIYYYEAGLRSLHPSYVQQMISSRRYQPVDILVMISALSRGETPTSYKNANIERALAELMDAPEGKDDVTGIWADQPVLLVAGGPQGTRHWEQCYAYARKIGARIIAVNHIPGVPANMLDGVICLHPARLMALLSDKSWAELPLYTSTEVMAQTLTQPLDTGSRQITDYGVKVAPDAPFEARANGCTIPATEALAYGWALAEQAGASALYLAGFDGYDGLSRAFQQANTLIGTLQEQSRLSAQTLTQSHFTLPTAAIYAD